MKFEMWCRKVASFCGRRVGNGRRDGGGIWQLNPFGPGTSTTTSVEHCSTLPAAYYFIFLNMSRNFIPAVLAIGMGVFTGMHLYTVYTAYH